MKVTKSPFAVRPIAASPLPPVAGAGDRPAPVDLRTAALALGALSVAPAFGDGVAEQCGEGVATLLEACGEGGAWPYACAGSAVGLALGGLHFAEARRRGDAAEMRAGLLRIGIGGLGMVAGSGLLAGHPAIEGCVEAVRAVLGSVTSPSTVTSYDPGLAPALRAGAADEARRSPW